MSEKILGFWEKDFKSSFEKHLSYLNKNIENQDDYSSKLSQILEQMEIFDSENDDENQDNKENENLNNENNNQDENTQSKDEQEKKREDEDQNGPEGDYDFNESVMDEQLIDTNSNIQKRLQLGILDIRF